jgi:hypothetical protein
MNLNNRLGEKQQKGPADWEPTRGKIPVSEKEAAGMAYT